MKDKYKELVNALRCCSTQRCDECPRQEWMSCYSKTEGEAADAIENLEIELQAMRDAANGFKRLWEEERNG